MKPRCFSPSLVLMAVVLVLSGLPSAALGSTLGRVDFSNSGAPEAQDAFIRGVLLLHSFEYEDAREAFREAKEIDPDFAMAYWGEAMTHNHPLWAQQDREKALEALAELGETPKAQLAAAPTDREKGYLETLHVLYGVGASEEEAGDKKARDRAYMDAMRDLHERYPEDLEAQAFYALSVLGSVGERDSRTYMRAGAIAEEVFAENALHPGAAHYLIHSYDDPIHAPLGLRAARVYATIAPDASHAQHMISHIYTALGQWPEVVEANRNAVRVSEERLDRLGRELTGRNKHSLYWLEYGLLQQGRFDDARAELETMYQDAQADPKTYQLWHYASMRATYVVGAPHRNDVPPALDLGEDSGLGARVSDHFANGLLQVRSGELDEARATLAALSGAREEATIAAAEEGKNPYDGATMPDDLLVAQIHELLLEAHVLRADGDLDAAIAKVETAAEKEASRPLEYGPPSVLQPSYELLGQLLLEAGRADDAVAAFAASLDRAPRRTLSLFGLERSARAAGDGELAEETAETLREIWQGEASWLERGGSSADAPTAAGR